MDDMKQALAFLNGRWIPSSQAVVSVGDAGFIQGTAIAEQVRTFAGELFRLDKHLTRLADSLGVVGLDPGMSLEQIARIGEDVVIHNHPLLQAGDDLGLSIVVTPGAYPPFSAPAPSQPTVCLHTYLLPFHLFAAKYRTGQALVTTDVEQIPAKCWPATLKCRSRMHYYLADHRAAAIDPQARALLLDSQGLVTEASTANVLIYRGGEGLVSPRYANILHGVSLSVVAELAEQLGIPFNHRDITVDDVAAADEVFLTSTTTCILPVTRFNGRPIGAEQPGSLFSRLLAAWSELVGVDIIGQAERFSDR
jgi:branched-chain amino acid aminotransferase